MKKIIAIILSFTFISLQALKAETGIGISGAIHFTDVSGEEITRTSNEVNSGSHSNETAIPELFIEHIDGDGVAWGLSYIPVAELGSKSRSDSNSEGDTGTYTGKAELDNLFQVYVDVPVSEAFGQEVYTKVGIQHATIATLESLNSGETYPDEDVMGLTLGLGLKGDLQYGNNLYYKSELTYTNFEEYNVVGTAGNKIKADIDSIAARFSVGYKF